MPTITINRLSLLLISVEPTNYGHEMLVMGMLGKRGKLLRDRWLAVRAPDGSVSRFTKWI